MKQFFLLFLLFPLLLFGQQDFSSLFNYINKTKLKEHVYKLSGDEFTGRGNCTTGGYQTAEYIAEQYNLYGLKDIDRNENPYYQPFIIPDGTAFGKSSKHGRITINGKKFKEYNDFKVRNHSLITEQKIELVYYNIDADS